MVSHIIREGKFGIIQRKNIGRKFSRENVICRKIRTMNRHPRLPSLLPDSGTVVKHAEFTSNAG